MVLSLQLLIIIDKALHLSITHTSSLPIVPERVMFLLTGIGIVVQECRGIGITTSMVMFISITHTITLRIHPVFNQHGMGQAVSRDLMAAI
jgi:hypothetical protein